MLTTLLIGVPAAALSLGNCAMGTRADEEPRLRAEWLYNPVHRAVMIDVAPPPATAPLSVVLMDAEGSLHAERFTVTAGPFDLAEAVPEIWRLRRAAYLQMFVGEEPFGASLVVQPLLSRLVPLTEEATSPSGNRYTKIVGWRDETAPPPTAGEVPDGTADRNVTKERDARSHSNGLALRPGGAIPGDPEYDPWLPNARPEGRLLSGLRIYPERDVVLRTTEGEIRLAMRPDHAPNTAWNFLELCEGGFYRGVDFHRVVPMTRDGDPFVIQAGDPTTSGSGGPGYWLPVEKSDLEHDFGVISMARDVDPDSAGSQIFICLSRKGTARLDGHYCSFGYAVDGASAIRAIAATELADIAAGRPVDPPIIESADLLPSPPRSLGAGRPDQPLYAVPAQEPPVPDAPKRRRVPR